MPRPATTGIFDNAAAAVDLKVRDALKALERERGQFVGNGHKLYVFSALKPGAP